MSNSETTSTTPTPPQRKPRRLGYKKSKTGCISCRTRRVKCDETKPQCNNCQRYGIECRFRGESEQTVAASAQSNAPLQPTVTETASQSSRTPQLRNPNESASGPINSVPTSFVEHRLELRLLHHFTTNTCKTLPGGVRPEVSERWAIHVPPLAMEHDNLLHAIFAVSAAHLRELEPNNIIYEDAARDYFALVMNEQYHAISSLNEQTADIVTLTCLLVQVLAYNFQRVEEMDDDLNSKTHASLVESLIISHGTAEALKTAWKWIRSDSNSEAAKILKFSPQYADVHKGEASYEHNGRAHRQLMYNDEHIDSLAYLLSPTGDLANSISNQTNDVSAKAIEQAVRRATSYIGFFQKAVKADEPESILCYRIMGFSAGVPTLFLDLAKNSNPQVLLILAHYFALTNSARGIWWVKDLGRRSVHRIWNVLPQQWRPLMRTAMEMLGEDWPREA